MPAPTSSQAAEHHAERAALAAAAGSTVTQRILDRRPWAETLTLLARYQLQAADLAIRVMAGWTRAGRPAAQARAFAGVSSYGYPISEPIVSTIDRIAPAPLQPLPAPWWNDEAEFARQVAQVIESEVADAARSAAQVEIARSRDTVLVRFLQPPSCKRCVVLAGVTYRDVEPLPRHPLCDCIFVPADGMTQALQRGLVTDPAVLLERGQVRGLSAADLRAINDGADLATVVNATRGTSAPGLTNALSLDLYGRTVKATTYGTTKRSQWRKANPTRRVRLRPESIYEFAKDHDDALRLLALYGYLK